MDIHYCFANNLYCYFAAKFVIKLVAVVIIFNYYYYYECFSVIEY